MEIRKMKLEQLTPAFYNPRKELKPGDDEYEKLKRSIETFGYVDPIIFNSRTCRVVGGHQRLIVLKDLGWNEVDVSVVDLSEEQEKALNIALNKISGEFDFPKLKDLLEELDENGFDLTLTGFDDWEIEELINPLEDEEEIEDDDFDVEEVLDNNQSPISQQGDIWILGKHRLMCGDSTNAEDVNRLMGDKKADLIVTDPPYNVAYKGKTKDSLTIKNDDMSNDEFYQFLFNVYSRLFEITKKGGSIYVFHADTEGVNFRKAMVDAGFKLSQCLVWVKQTMVMGRQDYHWQHEPILYGWKPGAPHSWYSDRKQTTVWKFDRPTKNDIHPTMKPIPLIAYPIKNSSKRNDIVVDLFGGSGSTLIACEQTGRINYSMELDEKYVDVIVQRYITLKNSNKENVFLLRNGEMMPYSDVIAKSNNG